MSRDEWAHLWGRLKTRGFATGSASTHLVDAAFRGVSPFQLMTLLDQAADDDERLGDIVVGTLALCCTLAKRNRTPQGLMEITATLLDIEQSAQAQTTRAAARLLLAHQITYDVANLDDSDRIDPAALWAIGANQYNTVLRAADDLASAVVVEALILWARLLPEISTRTVKAVAGQLFGAN